MKKKYEAPALEVITYSLHDAIAAGCANLVYNNHSEGSCELTSFGQTLKDLGATFAEDSCGDGGAKGTCYFTSTSVIFNS